MNFLINIGDGISAELLETITEINTVFAEIGKADQMEVEKMRNKLIVNIQEANTFVTAYKHIDNNIERIKENIKELQEAIGKREEIMVYIENKLESWLVEVKKTTGTKEIELEEAKIKYKKGLPSYSYTEEEIVTFLEKIDTANDLKLMRIPATEINKTPFKQWFEEKRENGEITKNEEGQFIWKQTEDILKIAKIEGKEYFELKLKKEKV